MNTNDQSNEYVVMSFNLLCGEHKPGDIRGVYFGTPWERKDAVLAQIRATCPDTLGVQECSTDWHYILCKELGDEYDFVGELTNYDKLIWRNAIFFRKDRFELVETKTRWLSETPDVMSRTPFYYQYRVMTHAVLKDKKTGKVFAHCNTHVGFYDDERPIHFRALIDMLNGFDIPFVVTGDYNAKSESVYCGWLREAGYVDAYDVAPVRDSEATYRGGVGHIDHCFLTPDTVEPLVHDILGDTVNGVTPSDHKALVVKFRLR